MGKNGIETPREEMEVCSSQVVQTIPMNHLGRKSCSAEASTIFEFHLHCTKLEFETVLLRNSSIKVIDNNLRSHTLISKLYLVPPVHAIRLCNRYHVFSVFFRLNQVQFFQNVVDGSFFEWVA